MNKLHKLTFAAAALLLALAPFTAVAEGDIDKDLQKAVQQGKHKKVAALIEDGADINATDDVGNTVLFHAAKVGDRLVMEVLLKNEAKVNVQNSTGTTPLMIAAKYGHPHVVKQLLKHGADPMIKNNNGVLASRFASAYEHWDTQNILEDAERDYGRS
ncbi:MAG: ankyrin repeat domain-containing protein [Balneolaceae bacterium]|nr:ankyrin repeat domain-containing protein [Balneolaceae bacterium]